MQKVSFIVGGNKLAACIFFPENPKEKNPAILFVHGWTSAMERSFQYAEKLSKLGYICFLFDMRGHGQSEGDIKIFTIKEFLDDVLTAYDFLLNIEVVDKENISAVGSSFGGYLVTLLSEKRKLKNLALRVPADYKNEDFDKSKYEYSGAENLEIVAWRKKVKKPNDTFALSAISKFDGEVLIIESEKDTIVPHETILNYINAVKNKQKLTHRVMKDAPHSIKEGKFRDEVTKILEEWFSKKL